MAIVAQGLEHSYRNLLINGDFRIWQRGLVGVDSSAAKYAADRFLFGCAGAAFAPYGLASESGMPLRTGMRIGVTAGNTGVAVLQRVESNNCPKVGEKLTFSWYIHGNIARTVQYSIKAGGSVDNFSSPTLLTTNTVNVASGGAWQRFSVTFTTTSACLNGIEVRLDLPSSSGIATADFSTTGWQLEVGEVATPFEHRPYWYELALCQRYYWRLNANPTASMPFASGVGTGATQVYTLVDLPVPMRSTPAVTFAGLRCRGGNDDAPVTSAASVVCSGSKLSMVFNTSVNVNNGFAYLVRLYSADGNYFAVEAEIY